MSLLNDASLVFIPSGYKEDKVYSIIPSNGAGDLDFVRGCDATRINPQSLVENTPWNLFNDTEDFTFGTWSKVNTTVTANTTVAPNGAQTADTAVISSAGYIYYQMNYSGTTGSSISISVYSKTSTTNLLVFGGATIAGTDTEQILSVGNGWYRHIITRVFTTTASGIVQFVLGFYTPGTHIIWGAQLNVGTIKPYFPTTDRLNVPRLDYTNSTCPSLLLEKQSTNLLYPSIPTTTYGNGTFTGNSVISPDGTQTAFAFSTNSYGFIYFDPVVYTTSQIYTYSVYLKGTVNGQKVQLKSDLNGVLIELTLTTNWQRYSVTFTAVVGSQNFYILSGSYLTPAQYNTFYGWGAQLEVSSYPTSYIKTTSATATRLADSCYKTGISSLIGQTSGAMFIDFNYFDNIAGSLELVPMYIGAGAYSDGIYFDVYQDVLYFTIWVSASQQALINCGALNAGRHKAAVSYTANDIKVYLDGALAGSDNSASIPTMSQINIGTAGSSTTIEAHSINQALLFKRVLTNTELANLTTL